MNWFEILMVFRFTILRIMLYRLCMVIKNLMCYSDFNSDIKLISYLLIFLHHYLVILHNIKKFLFIEWRIQLLYIFKEMNVCVDYITKYKVNNDVAYQSFMESSIKSIPFYLVILVKFYFLNNFFFLFLFSLVKRCNMYM